MTFRISAPAKVNLSLHITGRRDDGYHTLLTRMQKLDLCDLLELDLTDRGNIEISSDSKEIPVDNTNLAVQAAIQFFDRCGSISGSGLRISLKKRIPVAAGLGGGSSDAAAVLKGLNEMLDGPFSEDELFDVGRQLGADVPFFISDQAAVIATGIGDCLTKIAHVKNYHFVLVNPGFSVNTKWVYENYRLTKKNKKFKLCGCQNNEVAQFSINELHNDLEQVTAAYYPVLGQIKDSLMKAGAAGALMSGSGPTVFGMFTDRETASAACSRLQKIYKKKSLRIIPALALAGA